MKRALGCITILLVLSFGAQAFAEPVNWPSRSVIGVIGASYATATPPTDSPLQGVALAGGSYEGLDKKLLRNKLLEAWDFSIESTAQAGATS